MCDIELEICEVWHEVERKARKEHKCSCCNGRIEPKEQYYTHFSVLRGETTSEKICVYCFLARAEFAEAHLSAICTPGYFQSLLHECISEDPDDSEWREMLEAIAGRKAP